MSRRDAELVGVWEDLQRRGAVVVSLSYREAGHIATAYVRHGERREHAAAYTPAEALAICRDRLFG
jgi:hypothetical protein